jgi:hypothetical protein
MTTYHDLPAIIGPILRKDVASKSKYVYVDIHFILNNNNNSTNSYNNNKINNSINDDNELDCIVFQNFYTSYISISQFKSTNLSILNYNGNNNNNNNNNNGTYITILEHYQLMKDSYSEQLSQSYFSINCKEFNNLYEKNLKYPLRITLFQPSPIWKSYEIQNIKLLCKVKHSNPSSSLTVSQYYDSYTSSSRIINATTTNNNNNANSKSNNIIHKYDVNEYLSSSNILQLINYDYKVINDSYHTQKYIKVLPDLTTNIMINKRTGKKKDKKDKKNIKNDKTNTNSTTNISNTGIGIADDIHNNMLDLNSKSNDINDNL